MSPVSQVAQVVRRGGLGSKRLVEHNVRVVSVRDRQGGKVVERRARWSC